MLLVVQSLLLLAAGLTAVWIGSGIAINGVTHLAQRVKIPQFVMSFLVLGFLTSFSEIFVGINAFISNEPEVFVGNLLGSSVVVFMLVIPLFALLSRGINLNHTFSFNRLVMAALVVLLPALLSLDNKISFIDGFIMVVAYTFFMFIQGQESTKQLENVAMGSKKVKNTLVIIAKIVFSILVVFVGAKLIVDQILFLGTALKIEPFVLSFLVISIGTNIPELSIAIRSIFEHKKSIAFGNYVGSASFNTLELGILSMLHRQNIPALGSNFAVLLFAAGMLLFVIFSRSKNTITWKEALVLLMVYAGIVAVEIFLGKGWSLSR